MTSVPPGTYRIINVKAGKALTVSDGGEGYVFCWDRHDGRVQQWQVEQSGDRYRFKNCGTGQWLSVPNPESANDVCATRYHATWDLVQTEQDHGSYMIRFRDYDRVLDLDGWGADWNGNNAHMSFDTTWMPHRSWKFEPLGHEPRKEDQKLHKQIAERDHRLVEKEQQLVEKDRKLTEKADRITTLEKEKEEQTNQNRSLTDVATAECHNAESRRTQTADQHTFEDSEDISALQEALRRANETIRERDAAIAILQNQLLLRERADCETEGVAELLSRFARLESRLCGEVGPSGQNAA